MEKQPIAGYNFPFSLPHLIVAITIVELYPIDLFAGPCPFTCNGAGLLYS